MSVTALQSGLKRLGFDPGAIDGAKGPRTYQAVADCATNGRAPDDTGALMAKWLPFAGIDTRDEIIEFVANCAHESSFQPKEEGLSYSADRLAAVWPHRYAVDPKAKVKKPNALALSLARNPEALANNVYAGRMGNTQPGDGFRYRGRAGPQLTGRGAYLAVGDIVGMPFEDNPDLLLTTDGSMAAAVGFWKWKNLGAKVPDTEAVRRGWNGGLIGLDDVRAIGNRLREIWPS
jgi:putative chitinase